MAIATTSVDSIAPLVDAYPALADQPATFTARASAGTLNLTIRHDDSRFGEDLLRALWPPTPASAGHGSFSIRCLSAEDPRVAALLPPAPEGIPRLYVPEDFTGQRWLFDWTNGLHTGVDLTAGTGLVIWQHSAYSLLMSGPFRTALQWWASNSGALLLHAAAVGRPAGGVLLLGAGRAGKSTTTMAGVVAGGVTAGDDYVWVDASGTKPTAYSCYRTVKTRHSSALEPAGITANLPGFDVHYDEPKRIHYLAEGTTAMARRLPLVGAAVIKKGVATTQWRLISTAEAVLKTAPSTIFQASSDRARQMTQITGLLAHLPCYEVSVSSDLEEVGGRILKLVDELARKEHDR
jgi:hypothetical protein